MTDRSVFGDITGAAVYIAWCGTGAVRVHLPNGISHDMPHQTMVLLVDREQMPGPIRVENLEYHLPACSANFSRQPVDYVNGFVVTNYASGGWQMKMLCSDMEEITL